MLGIGPIWVGGEDNDGDGDNEGDEKGILVLVIACVSPAELNRIEIESTNNKIAEMTRSGCFSLRRMNYSSDIDD